MRDKVEKWGHYFIAFSFIGWVYEVLVFAFELHYGYDAMIFVTHAHPTVILEES